VYLTRSVTSLAREAERAKQRRRKCALAMVHCGPYVPSSEDVWISSAPMTTAKPEAPSLPPTRRSVLAPRLAIRSRCCVAMTTPTIPIHLRTSTNPSSTRFVWKTWRCIHGVIFGILRIELDVHGKDKDVHGTEEHVVPYLSSEHGGR